MKKIISIFGMLVLLLGSCIEEFNAQLPEGEDNILVVDGSIIGDSLCTFYLSRSAAVGEGNAFKGEMSASVKVVGSDGTEWPGTLEGDGVYQVQVGALTPGVSYQLQIQSKGLIYTSHPQTPMETPQLADSLLVRENEAKEEASMLLYLTMRGSSNDYYRISYLQDWEIRAVWKADVEYNRNTGEIVPVTLPIYRGWKSDYADNPYLLAASKYGSGSNFPIELYRISLREDNLSYRHCTSVLLRAISKEEYEYEKIRSQISNEMGGLFTPQPSELPTNITCSDPSVKVIGYVGVSKNVALSRYYINTTQVNCIYNINNNERCEAHPMSYYNADSFNVMYNWGYRLVGSSKLWARGGCVDVRLNGATLEKPAWWQEEKNGMQ